MKKFWMNSLGILGVVALALSIVIAPGAEKIGFASVAVGFPPGVTENFCEPTGTPGHGGTIGTCVCSLYCRFTPDDPGGTVTTYQCEPATIQHPTTRHYVCACEC